VIPAPAPSPAPVAPIAPLEERAAAPARPEAPAKAESGPVAPVVPRTEAPAVATQPDFRAAYLNNPPPRYPLAARRQGEEGTVMLRVLVDRSGRAAGVELERSSGSSRLDQAAIEAVKSWRFVPAKRGSESVDATVLVPIIFKLDGGT
jgi:protein TonB